jgi:hypothetical protein
MHLTNLQKRYRARWQMLFHPTELRSEFCNPLTFGQIHLSCAFCALLGWNMTQKIRLSLHHWSIPPSPSMQYFILIGWKNPVLSGPDIVFRPEHKKCSANFTKHPLQHMKLKFVFAVWPKFRSPNNVEKACQPPSESTDVLILITSYLNYY